ncbi:hypothetical protein [Tumebacillus algifaecis]|uniref:hypothetical protein n=1 Tax=Tumebacillus algifaecis TaxID=1214604 RepID=UPI001D13151E|nr:hypothetical protein [Tumebacillus algifaecis]
MCKAEREQEKRILQLEKGIDKLKAENRKYLKLLADETITKDEYKEITEYNRLKMEQLQKDIVVAKQSMYQQSKN